MGNETNTFASLPQEEAWFDDIEARFEFSAEHKLLFGVARQAWRRCNQIRGRRDEEGVVWPGRFVPRANPLISLEVTTRNAFIRALKALDLPEDEDG